ncbi:ankyrin repeat and SOCS box protein 13 [Trichonephila clavipes]|nr:ankyrin repeat and SOCS box protein 13 [Trichonephila clavipes]
MAPSKPDNGDKQGFKGSYAEYQKRHKGTFPNSYQGCIAVFCNPFSFNKINASSADGGTPLCDACAVGSADCVHLLLQEGADVNPVLALSTPLHEACARGSPTCVSLLIQAGANLNTNDCHVGTPLHTATLRNHFDCARLLLQSGAPVNAVKIHETPLHIAARENHLDLARLLLQYGANVYARQFYDLLIHYASFPPTLKDICRRKIRITLGCERLKFLPDLEIP